MESMNNNLTRLRKVSLFAATLPAETEIMVEKMNLKPDSKSDGFVFGLDEKLVREKGKVAQVYVEGDDLETKNYQVAMVTATFVTQLLIALAGIQAVVGVRGGLFGSLEVLAIAFTTWVLADGGSGIFHWSVDNYGNGRTPILGNIIAAFQGHHTAPWTITQREFCNNVHKLCIPFGPVVPLASLALGAPPGFTFGISLFCFLEVMSQELHKWTHMTKREAPSLANKLMDRGLILGRVSHTKHHSMPFEGNYCIVSGFCNDAMDKSGFFRFMELMVFKANGIEANSWKLDERLKKLTLQGKFKEANDK